jgi:hypothetical protein
LPHVANVADASGPSVRSSGKVLSFSRLTPYLVALGCVVDLLSTFFPWTAIFTQQRYLPYSIVLPLGERVQFLYADFLILVVVVAVRAAAIVGFGGLVLYVYHKGVLFSLVLIVSMVLSFSSVAIFAQLFGSFLLGPYLVSLAGILKLAGLILKNLRLEIEKSNDQSAS